MEPICSVVVPVYNVSLYLGECMESLLNQTEPRLEVILVDDGSTDGSGELCDEWAGRDARVRVLHQENQGVSVARNAGTRMATAPWLTFVDSDDWLEPDTFEKCFAAMEDDVDVFLFGLCRVYGEKKVYNCHGTGEIVDWRGEEVQKLTLGVLDKFAYASPKHPKMHVSSIISIYRRDFLEKGGVVFRQGYRFHEDWLFKLESYQKADHVRYIDSCFYNYRMNENSVMHAYRPGMASISAGELEQIWQEHIKQLPPHLQAAFFQKCAQAFIDCVLLDHCNRKNKASYKKRRESFVRERELFPFNKGFAVHTYRQFPLKYKVFYALMRYRLFFLLDIVCRIAA